MIDRRLFLALASGALLDPGRPAVAMERQRLALYANVGYTLLHYDVDVDTGELTRRADHVVAGAVPSHAGVAGQDPLGVQYAWPHASGRVLYVACSDWKQRHTLTALLIDPATGALSQLGRQVQLPERPINVCTDVPSRFVLVAFSKPSGVRVYQVEADLSLGAEVDEPGVTDGGVFAHQVRVTPDNRHAILVTRGNNATATRPEDPGALKMFDYAGGRLTNEASIAPDGGRGFGPRHLDFHPTRPWVYVSLERESKLDVYRLRDGRLEPERAWRKETVADPGHMRPRQMAGAIHVHPNGRYVYVANRADATVDADGVKMFAGGENVITVYAIDQDSGEPVAIQHADTRKIYPRTFAIDPTGRLMVVQHTLPVRVRRGDDVVLLATGFTVFRVGDDGRLAFVRTVDVDVGDDGMFWAGLVPL